MLEQIHKSYFACYLILLKIRNKFSRRYLNFPRYHLCRIFPKLHFFVPEIIFKIKDCTASVLYNPKHSILEIDNLFNQINAITINETLINNIELKSRVSKEEYIRTISSIKTHLQRGDIYEMNYCQEFYSDNLELDPFSLFAKLNNISQAPFSAFYRINNHFCLCSSPERFLKKEANKIISQPIKGTIKRLEDNLLDKENQNKLMNSSKDVAENVMNIFLVFNVGQL